MEKSNKYLWRPWCNSSIRTCGVLGAGAEPVGLPRNGRRTSFKPKKRKVDPPSLKRPSKRILYNLYWKKGRSQTDIAKIFNVTHTSVRRWLRYYRIPIKPRALSCGRHARSLKNLELGKTPEVEKKSAEARTIYSKEKIIEKIKEFIQKEGRIPSKNEFNKSTLYPNHTTCRDYFGSWNDAIQAAGFKPNEQWFSSAKNLYAQDGHPCNSISEIIVDDWLLKNNIPHRRECSYPKVRRTCDFVVGNTFIEFFGLSEAATFAPNYPAIIEEKKRLCRKYGITLIELYEKDLHGLNQTLGKKLEDMQTKRTMLGFLTREFHKLQAKLF